MNYYFSILALKILLYVLRMVSLNEELNKKISKADNCVVMSDMQSYLKALLSDSKRKSPSDMLIRY